MDPCTEILGTLWMQALQQITPTRRKEIQAFEDILIAKQEIENTLQKLNSEKDALQRQADKCSLQIKTLAKVHDKNGARQQLQKRRRYMAQINKLENIQESLEIQMETIATSETNTTVFEAFRKSTAAFTAWQKNSSLQKPEEVDSVRQDWEEQMQNAQEIAQAASQPLIVHGAQDMSADEMTLDEIVSEIDQDLAKQARVSSPARTAQTHVPHNLAHSMDTIEEQAVTQDEPQLLEAL
jgi:hypothetical protein